MDMIGERGRDMCFPATGVLRKQKLPVDLTGISETAAIWPARVTNVHHSAYDCRPALGLRDDVGWTFNRGTGD